MLVEILQRRWRHGAAAGAGGVRARARHLKIGSIEDLIRYRLATEHTIERVDEREIDTAHGPFRLLTYRDRLSRELHFALVRGAAACRTRRRWCACTCKNPLSDVLHWQRAGFRHQRRRGDGRDRRAKAAAWWWCCPKRCARTTCCARITEQPGARAAPSRRRVAPQRRRRADPGRPGPAASCACSARRAARSGWPATGWRSWNTCAGPRRPHGLLNCQPNAEIPDHAPIRRRPARRCRRPLRHPRQPLEPAHHRCAGRRRAPRAARAMACAEAAVDVVRVPGAWELPVAAAALAAAGSYVALVALGCVIRGETRHYEQVADECARGLMRVALDHRAAGRQRRAGGGASCPCRGARRRQPWQQGRGGRAGGPRNGSAA